MKRSKILLFMADIKLLWSEPKPERLRSDCVIEQPKQKQLPPLPTHKVKYPKVPERMSNQRLRKWKNGNVTEDLK